MKYPGKWAMHNARAGQHAGTPRLILASRDQEHGQCPVSARPGPWSGEIAYVPHSMSRVPPEFRGVSLGFTDTNRVAGGPIWGSRGMQIRGLGSVPPAMTWWECRISDRFAPHAHHLLPTPNPTSQILHCKMASERRRGRQQRVCSWCSQSFTKDDHLMRHIRTHTREKPFVCGVCRKAFSRQCAMALPVRYETD